MHKHLTSFWQNPSQKFSKNFIDFEKSQNFPKTRKVRLQIVKCIMKRGIKDLTSEEEQDQDQRRSGEKIWSEWKVFGKVRSLKGSKEIKKSEWEIVQILYIETS